MSKRYLVFAVLIALFALAAPALAQSDTITVDTGVLFTQTNSWITVLLPIFAIGGGIAIAAAVLTLIVSMIKKALVAVKI